MSAIIKFQEEYVMHLLMDHFALRHDGTEFSIWVGDNYARLASPDQMERIADKIRDGAAALRTAQTSLPLSRQVTLTARIRPMRGGHEMELLCDGMVIDDGFYSEKIEHLKDDARLWGIEPEVVE